MNTVLNILSYRKHWLVVLILSFTTLSINAQTFVDYKNSESFNERISIAEKLGTDYLELNLDSLRILGYDLLSYSNSSFNEEGINYAKKYLGSYLIRTANELKGLELLRTSKNYFLSKQDYTNVTEICVEIGNSYQFSKKIEESIKWYKQSLKYGKLSPDPEIEKIALINLAQAYLVLKDFDLANKHALEYRDWVLSLGKYQSVANSYAVLGKISLAEKEYEKAISYFEINEKFATKSGAKASRAHAFTNIGISKFYLGQTDQCLSYFQKALDLRLEVKNVEFICDAYLNLGGIYFELSDFEKAEENYNKGLKLAVEHEKFSLEMEMIVALIELKKVKGHDVGNLERDYNSAKERHMTRLTEKNAVDVKLEKELTDSLEREHKDKPMSKWAFYIGATVIFFVFVLLAVRKKLI